jgi:hypothetical protein
MLTAPGMTQAHQHRTLIHTQALDFWLARCAVAAVAALQVLIINDLSIGPRWLAPAIELALLVPLSFATAWNQKRARLASAEHHWNLVARHRKAIRALALSLTAIVSMMNLGALLELVRALLAGKSSSGTTLLLDALNIWVTNVVAFALWFWGVDRGGPAVRSLKPSDKSDFLFPQMTLAGGPAFSPGFIDYLFVSFTTATAFSPTDTLPLSARAKLLMMAEALISLLTVALVAARAVNILS